MHGKEARYNLSSFELNRPGYLFHVGTGKYIGIASGMHNRPGVRDNAEDALRLRAYLSIGKYSQGIILLQDQGQPKLQAFGPHPPEKLLHNMTVFGLCSDTDPKKIVLKPYRGGLNTSFFFTPPILTDKSNSFQIVAGSDCLEVDKNTLMLNVSSCTTDPHDVTRFMQFFSWVDADTFNRGIDPTTTVALQELDSVFRSMSRNSLSSICGEYLRKMNKHANPSYSSSSPLTSFSTLPHLRPYSIKRYHRHFPSVCERYIRENYIKV